MVWNWLQRHPRLVDVAIVLVALATEVGWAARSHRAGTNVPLALAVSLPLLARRTRPLAVLVLTTAGTVAILAVSHAYNPFPVGISLFTVAVVCDRRTSLRAGGAALAVLVLPLWASSGWTNASFVGRFGAFAVAWLIGDSLRTRRRYIASLEERAERLEREREAEAARAVAEEQTRIARELHDVIAHNVSVMVVQAAAANDVFETQPAKAREALRAIETTGRGALAELRRLLGVVRGDDTEYAPQPGLDRLDDLVAQVRAAGLAVAVSVQGEPRSLPAGIDLSAYRVVQEALTNTLKHAGATRADVLLRYRDGELGVEVRDNGTAPVNGTPTGHGLLGMRERVGLFGGSLDAGPAPGGGFAVAARFPLETGGT